MGYTRQCAVFQNQSVPEVVEQVLRKHGLEGPDFEFRLERTYLPREIITQWRETDLQFIQRILSEVGIYWRTEMDDVRGLDTRTYLPTASLTTGLTCACLTASHRACLTARAESVWMRTWHRSCHRLCRHWQDYNYRTASTPMDATVSVRNDAVTTGEHYRYAAPYVTQVTTPAWSRKPNPALFMPASIMSGTEQISRIQFLFSNAAHLTPGQVLGHRATSLRPCKRVLSSRL
ncbi:phage late control D family protein [Enterobacter roggenkampii]